MGVTVVRRMTGGGAMFLQPHGAVTYSLYLPESASFRGWYTSVSSARIAAHLERLHADTGVPQINARHWADDTEFLDGYHLLPEGARRFTRRLGREVLPALLCGPAAGAAPGPQNKDPNP